METFFYTVLLNIVINIAYNHATDCKWTVNGQTLDLSSLHGETMQHFDGSYTYSYTICDNGLECMINTSSTINVMSKYYKTADRNNSTSCTKYCAIFNSSVVPSLDEYYGVWKFEYFTGEICQYSKEKKPSVFRVYFNCNHKAVSQPIVTSSAEVIPCEYEMIIETNLACNITKNQNQTNCIFTDMNSGSVLDLSSIKNTILEYSNYDEMYQYNYMICGNGLNCTNASNKNSSYNGLFVMSNQISVKHEICETVLGEWNDGIIKPIYEPINRMWKFHFLNGYQCENKPREFIANFICNTSAYIPNVINATEFRECKYQMDIETVFACN